MNAFAVNFSFGAYLLSILGYGAGYISRKKYFSWIGLTLIVWAFIVQTIYLGWRWVRGTYAPMSNMYESLFLMTWLVTIIYLGFLVKYKASVPTNTANDQEASPNSSSGTIQASTAYPLLGLGFWVALFCLILLSIASLNDRSIQSLMPALQSNWLLFHVTTTMFGYAAFALSFLTAGVYLTCFRKRMEEHKAQILDDLMERSIVLGFLFLTIGIILGSVWANSAWGSYWSWDPKETWSLITWFFYAVAIHLRKERNWRNAKFALLSLSGFALVLFTYFGVNYILSGLHSYA